MTTPYTRRQMLQLSTTAATAFTLLGLSISGSMRRAEEDAQNHCTGAKSLSSCTVFASICTSIATTNSTV